ncbi:MAG TPA: phosphoserine phosphatase SerB [Croceibacterium sp.]|nr:phosphoserine phosphatase SerB [Croceibacterium sp.]
MLIARLIADTASLETRLDAFSVALAHEDMRLAEAQMIDFCSDVLELELPEGDPKRLGALIQAHFAPVDWLVSQDDIRVPKVFVSDMDSTMIGQECIDELADFAGIKDKIATITERAMQGELDFEAALRERVGLLQGLSENAITECLDTRISPMEGARVLVGTLKHLGCKTVLVTGGFHQFADPVAEMLGFQRVTGNRLAVEGGVLTGGLVGAIVDSSVKKAVLLEEAGLLGENAVTLVTGDGANDIPMIEAATYGVAYNGKPKVREAANGSIERGDLRAILKLLGIRESEWVAG